MNWIEVTPLPQECRRCREADCYNCDVAGKRWVLTEQAELQIRRNAVRKKMEKLYKELEQIDSKPE